MISRKRNKFALIVLYGNAQTVGIGIGTEHHVRMDPICQRNAHRKRFLVFGIGYFYGGKFRIFLRLFLHRRDVDPEFFQDLRDGNVTRTVYGRVDEF